MSAAPVLSARGLAKRHGAVVAVGGVDLDLYSGEILCLLGPSGCGKSSLLRLLTGLERPDLGELHAGDRRLAGIGCFVPPEKRGIGLVFQDIALFPHLTAAQNVAFGLCRGSAAERRSRALEELRRFHLEHRANAYPHTLSGGEQQRVGIARALAPEPLALLLDEPFSGLDGELRARIREEVMTGLRASGTAILLVTHDPEEAMLLGDRLALMLAGRIAQVGTPDDCYRRPVSAAAAGLLGRVNLLPAQVSGGVGECALGTFPARHLPDGRARALVRPEQLAAVPGSLAKVVGQRFGGTYREVSVALGDTLLTLRLPPGAAVPDNSIGLQLVDPPHFVAD